MNISTKNIFRWLWPMCLIVVCCFPAQSQLSFGQYYQAGLDAMAKGNYSAALAHFDQAHSMDETDIDALYHLAEASRLQYAYAKASENFAALIDIDEENSYPTAAYKLGILNNTLGQYEAAVNNLDLYLSEYDDLNETITAHAKQVKSSATWAMEQMSAMTEDDRIQVINLGAPVNTGYSEHAPVFHDGELEYSALRYPIGKKSKTIVSKVLSGDSLMRTMDNRLFNSDDYLTSNIAYTADGETQFYTLCQYVDKTAKIKCDIYYRKLLPNKTWGQDKKLPQMINTPYASNTQVAVGSSKDGQTDLYFVSDRNGGQGGMDIWKTSFDASYNFQQPQNLEEINTTGDDITPHYSDGDILYFSSDTRLGYGGHDIYEWNNGKVKNLGPDINSSFNDIYFHQVNEESAYFSSNRIGSAFLSDKFETCCYDIYRADLKACTVDLFALTFDDKTKRALPDASITIVDNQGKKFDANLQDYNRSEYKVPCSGDLTLTISKDGYESKSLTISSDGNPINENIYLTPIAEPLPDLVSLTIKTFERATKSPLQNVQLQIKDSSGNIIGTNFSDVYGKSDIAVRPGQEYVITAMKEGYEVELDRFTVESNPRSNMSRDIYLGRIAEIASLNDLIPLKLYFNNDRPNRRTMQTKTEKSYSDTYSPYYAQKDKFQRVFSEQFSGERKLIAESDVYDFFEQDLRKGYESLTIFMETLQRILESGQRVNLYLRGYASPLSQSAYNDALAKRRVNSVQNEFERYNRGVLRQYITSGQLVITERSFGELQSATRVSDDFTNPALSIFSPDACKERRIEIDEIRPIN